MDKRKQPIEEFVKGTDFMAKLRAALENIEQGRGYAVFEGLQKKGTCTIAITYDGGDAISLAAVDVPNVRPEVRAKEILRTPESKPERASKK